MKFPILTLAVLIAAQPAVAKVAVTVTLGVADSVHTEGYSCGGAAPISVRYVNAGPNSLAILPVEGEERIFVNVVAASGARYVSGAHVWWSKGDGAALDNQLQDTTVECVRQSASVRQ